MNLVIETDTPEVRDLINTHPGIARQVEKMYEEFTSLVESLRTWNADRYLPEEMQSKNWKPGVAADMKAWGEALSQGADFRLVVLLSYRGTNLTGALEESYESLLRAMDIARKEKDRSRGESSWEGS